MNNCSCRKPAKKGDLCFCLGIGLGHYATETPCNAASRCSKRYNKRFEHFINATYAGSIPNERLWFVANAKYRTVQA